MHQQTLACIPVRDIRDPIFRNLSIDDLRALNVAAGSENYMRAAYYLHLQEQKKGFAELVAWDDEARTWCLFHDSHPPKDKIIMGGMIEGGYYRSRDEGLRFYHINGDHRR